MLINSSNECCLCQKYAYICYVIITLAKMITKHLISASVIFGRPAMLVITYRYVFRGITIPLSIPVAYEFQNTFTQDFLNQFIKSKLT